MRLPSLVDPLLAQLKREPTLPADPHWLPLAIAVIVAIFIAALIVGPWVRRRLPTQLPLTHSHEEPPAHGGPGRH